jgi:glycosyltransferase involved in cell wall biosynthesis
MAAGGIAFTGSTGEDYAIPYRNAFVLETSDPREIECYLMYLKEYPEEAIRIRTEAQRTAAYFTWEEAADNLISKLENQARLQKVLVRRASLPQPELKEAVELKLLKVANRCN